MTPDQFIALCIVCAVLFLITTAAAAIAAVQRRTINRLRDKVGSYRKAVDATDPLDRTWHLPAHTPAHERRTR